MNLPRAISGRRVLRDQTTDRLGVVRARVGSLEAGSVAGSAVDRAHSLGLWGLVVSREERCASVLRDEGASLDNASTVGLDDPVEMVIA
jgi:hypothetical protein